MLVTINPNDLIMFSSLSIRRLSQHLTDRANLSFSVTSLNHIRIWTLSVDMIRDKLKHLNYTDFVRCDEVIGIACFNLLMETSELPKKNGEALQLLIELCDFAEVRVDMNIGWAQFLIVLSVFRKKYSAVVFPRGRHSLLAGKTNVSQP